MKPFFCLLAALALVSCGTTPLAAPLANTALTLAVDQPWLVPIHYEGERYQSVRDWSYHRGETVDPIPAGTVVDGASVPRSVWAFMPPDGLHRAGAFAHDWLYAHQGRMPNGDVVTRAEADAVFYNLMRRAGVGKWRAGTAYRAVRMAGWQPWRRSSGVPLILPLQPTAPASPVTVPILKPRHLYAAP